MPIHYFQQITIDFHKYLIVIQYSKDSLFKNLAKSIYYKNKNRKAQFHASYHL
jgi:hypothetical protein